MGTILAYIFASAICLAVLLSVYKITLAEKKQPGFNRAVLLAILAASFVIPFIWDVAKVNPVAAEAEAVMPETMVVSGDDVGAESEPAEYSIPVDAPETADPVAVTAPADYSDIPAETVVAENPLPVAEDGRHSPAWLGIIVLLWCIGSLVALAYTLVSLARGFVALARGKKVMVNGARCVLVEGRQDTPYAFWGHIFLSDGDMDEKSEMVMLHELSHLRHRHGVDLLIARSVTILQWWNPFAWMLLVELHAVHEYQADGDVLLENGVDEKRYQYLLVERAAARSGMSLANGFAHNRLKKRLLMMKRGMAGGEGRLKAAWLVPGSLLALAILAMPMIGEASDSLIDLTYMAEKLDEGIKKFKGESPEEIHHSDRNDNSALAESGYGDGYAEADDEAENVDVSVEPVVVSHNYVDRRGDSVRVVTKTTLNVKANPVKVTGLSAKNFGTTRKASTEYGNMSSDYSVTLADAQRRYEQAMSEYEAKMAAYQREYESKVKEYDKAFKDVEKRYKKENKRLKGKETERERMRREKAYVDECKALQEASVAAQSEFAGKQTKLADELYIFELGSEYAELAKREYEQAQRQREQALAQAEKHREQAQRQREQALAQAQKQREQAQRQREQAQRQRDQAQKQREQALAQAQKERRQALAEAHKAEEEARIAIKQAQEEIRLAQESANAEHQKALAEARKALEKAEKSLKKREKARKNRE